VISIAQQAYGEGIRPGSFSVGNLLDDGKGNIVASGSATRVGHIFYGLGVVAIKPAALSFASEVEVTFDATHTIYEHQVMCTMEEGEFNFSTNPSMRDKTAPRRLDLFASGALSPYMTTVGLYTDGMELVAIGKFPRPIKRVSESQQTVIIRFDV
jgi:hypothetical protein